MSIFCGGGIAKRAVDTIINRCRTGALGLGYCHIYLSAIIYSRVLGDSTLVTKH